MAAYARALELDPELPAVWSNRAAAHGKLGEQEEAAECARRAVELLRARLGRCGGAGREGKRDAVNKDLQGLQVRRCQALGAPFCLALRLITLASVHSWLQV